MRRWRSTLEEYELYDEGHLVVRQLDVERFVGLRLPEFRSLRGKSREAVRRQHDTLEATIRKGNTRNKENRKPRRQGYYEYNEQCKEKRMEKAAAEQRLAFEWLRRKWV